MKHLGLVLLALCSIFFSSCKDKIMGYSIALWNEPEAKMQGGQIVPVYIRSNISHVYIIGTPDGEKKEIDLWKLTDPLSKSKIKKLQPKYAEFASYYASVKLDGLPCRSEPVNTAKQVYRLRKGEVIKILYKGKGQVVMAGKKPLEGDWFRILTNNGTMGWCFSYNLNLYEVDENGNKLGVTDVEETELEDQNMNLVIENTWYPDYFTGMISSGNIDLGRLHPSYNFTIDEENKKVSLNTTEIHQSWEYKGFTKNADNEFALTDTPVVVIYRRSNFIVLRYTGESGKPQELNFVTIDADLNEIIENERNRRNIAGLQLWSHGPVYSSSNYGKLTLNEDGSFHWNNFRLLVPSVVKSTARSYGTFYVKYAVGKSLSSSYDGVVTFKFDGTNDEVNFLYRLEDDGLRMEDAVTAKFNGNQIIERSSSPMILYFKTPVKNTDFTSKKEN